MDIEHNRLITCKVNSGIEELVGITKSADNKIVIRDAQNQPLNPRVELKNGVTIGVKRHTQTQDKFDELL